MGNCKSQQEEVVRNINLQDELYQFINEKDSLKQTNQDLLQQISSLSSELQQYKTLLEQKDRQIQNMIEQNKKLQVENEFPPKQLQEQNILGMEIYNSYSKQQQPQNQYSFFRDFQFQDQLNQIFQVKKDNSIQNFNQNINKLEPENQTKKTLQYQAANINTQNLLSTQRINQQDRMIYQGNKCRR